MGLTFFFGRDHAGTSGTRKLGEFFGDNEERLQRTKSLRRGPIKRQVKAGGIETKTSSKKGGPNYLETVLPRYGPLVSEAPSRSKLGRGMLVLQC